MKFMFSGISNKTVTSTDNALHMNPVTSMDNAPHMNQPQIERKVFWDTTPCKSTAVLVNAIKDIRGVEV
jgi:hypothetical protein